MTTEYTTSSSQTLPEGSYSCYDDQTACDPPAPCGCPYGILANDFGLYSLFSGKPAPSTKFDNQNPLNQELISAKLNYDNVEIITGSCVDNSWPDEETTRYWVKYKIDLHNFINRETYYDLYNCVYDVGVTLYIDGEEYNQTEELVNLVQPLPTNDEEIESYDFIVKKEEITNVVVLERETCPSDIKLKVCFLSGKPSTTDQVTKQSTANKKIQYTCECCQEYTSFTSYCDESTEDNCIPCNNESFLLNHKFLINNNEEVSELLYTVDINEPCLVHRSVLFDDSGEKSGINHITGYIARGSGESNTSFHQKTKSKGSFSSNGTEKTVFKPSEDHF